MTSCAFLSLIVYFASFLLKGILIFDINIAGA